MKNSDIQRLLQQLRENNNSNQLEYVQDLSPDLVEAHLPSVQLYKDLRHELDDLHQNPDAVFVYNKNINGVQLLRQMIQRIQYSTNEADCRWAAREMLNTVMQYVPPDSYSMLLKELCRSFNLEK